MPYVLKNRNTSEIFSCNLINKYDFEYHGAKSWEEEEEAVSESIPFLELYVPGETSDWEILKVDEMKMKMFNVKLNNNPARRLFLDADGKAYVTVDNT